MYHEVHNEVDPAPDRVAQMITDWVHAHIGETFSSIPGAQDHEADVARGDIAEGGQSTGVVGQSKL